MALSVEKIIPDAYNLHEKEVISDVCENGFIEYAYPRSGVSTGVLDFNIEGSNEHCIIPNKTFMKCTFEITGHALRKPPEGSAAGTPPTVVKIGESPKPAEVYAVNNIFHSAFESVEVYINNQIITKADKHNAYIAYIQQLCDYSPEALNTYFRLSGWGKDTGGSMDSLNDGENRGIAGRKSHFQLVGNTYKGEFIGRLCSPIFAQAKILPTQLSMRVIVKRGNDKFCLMHERGDFQLHITNAVLMVQKVSLVSRMKETYIKMLDDGYPMQIFMKTPTINYYSIEKNSTQFMRDDLFLGKMPRRLIIAMVATDAYHGNNFKNPLNISDFGVIYIVIYKDGMAYPYPPIHLDMSAGFYAEAYHNFMKALGCAHTNKIPPVTMDDFKAGYTLFGYDMSPDQMGSIHPATLMNMNSNIRLEMKFNAPLKENVTLLVYSEMETMMEIQKDRKVVMNF